VKFTKTPIEGLLIVEPTVFKDDRGYFFESYNAEKFRANGISEEFLQDNQSFSKKNVIRGLHFQAPPFAQAKLVRVIKGAVLDVAVDIRKNSPTYGKHFSIELSEHNQLMFYLPVGFAHGFSVLEDNTIFSYKCSNLYDKPSEGGIVWNDETLDIDWGIAHPIISEKDKELPDFKSFKSPF
jgi:dTDP-4-dehydrorhamnose 3,5-epimerase